MLVPGPFQLIKLYKVTDNLYFRILNELQQVQTLY